LTCRNNIKHNVILFNIAGLSLEDGDVKRLRERLHELNYKDYGYMLIANKLPAQYRGTAHFSFLQNIPWVAVVDLFDPSSKRDGLHYACNETTDALRAKVRTLDDFKEATDKDSLLSTRGTTWILSNEEMQTGGWIMCSKDCLYRALSAYKECFLPGRLVCVFLCFGETAVEEMADIMESSFSILGNSASSCVTIISETKPVAEAFINASKLSLRKELRECSITGIPWVLFKEIVREMVGPSKFEEKGATTELPYFTGQVKEVLNKTVNSWNDLEVYSPNPRLPKFAEAIEKERDAFYKGAQASQINLVQDHSIPRSLEKEVNTKVERALKSLSKEIVDANYLMKTITLPYEPGSGATTLCRRILWNRRKDYRCAVVKAITPSTDYQIDKLQSIGYDEKNFNYSLPVLVLVDNFPERDVRLLTEQIMKRQTKCVVLATLPIAKSATNTKFEITPLRKLDELETNLVKNILINIMSDNERRREAEEVLEREKRFIWFGLELFGRDYLKIEERLQNHIHSILISFLGDSQRMHKRMLDMCCLLDKYSDGWVILPHSVVLDCLYDTSLVAKQRCSAIQDVHEVFGGLLVEEQNETNGYYGWRPAHSLVSEVVIAGISLEGTAIRTLDEVCSGKAYVMKFLRQHVFRLFLERKRISDPVFVEEQATDEGVIGTDLENEVFGFYGKRTRYSPVIMDILAKESNIQGALNVLLTICEKATQTEEKAYVWQQLARFMGYEMHANQMEETVELHKRLYHAMTKEHPVRLSMPRTGIDAAHIAVNIAVSYQPSYVNHYTTKGVLYLLQLRDFKPPLLPSLPEAIEICRKALGVYDKALQNSREPNHFSMIGKIQAIVSLLQIIKDLHCFEFEDRKFTAYLKQGDVTPEIAAVLSQNDQDYVQGLCSTTLDLLNELFGNVKLKQTTTYDENELRALNNAKLRASSLRRKFYEITGFDKRELTTEEYSVCHFSSTNEELQLALYQQSVQDMLFFKDETPYSAWSTLTDADVSFIYKLLKPLCLRGRGSHNDMLICSKACLQLENRPPVDELHKIVKIWVEKFPESEWAHLFYYMIHFPIPNGSLAPYNADTKASVNKCASIVRQKAGSGFRKSGAEYFLGKGLGLNAILSSQEFRWLETKWKTKTEFWRGKETSERLERVLGQKDAGSKGIISYKGIQLHFDNTLYPNESKDDLWFYVGFTVAGPYAYDPVDNDTYATLKRQTASSTSLPTAYSSSERSNDSEKRNISSRCFVRSKTRVTRNSSETPQDETLNQRHYVKKTFCSSPPTSHYVRSSPRLLKDVSDWGFPQSSSSSSANQNYSISSLGVSKSAPRTDMATGGSENRKWQAGKSKERENWKSVEGTCGHKRRTFDPKYVSRDGKLHHGAFVLGTRKSQECECHTHTSRAEIKVTDDCNFAHGWRGDTLQHVCTKCTDENLTCCREKTKHEQFIWNLGPYYTSSGEIWSRRSSWGSSRGGFENQIISDTVESD